jgi:hypothetical protein
MEIARYRTAHLHSGRWAVLSRDRAKRLAQRLLVVAAEDGERDADQHRGQEDDEHGEPGALTRDHLW